MSDAGAQRLKRLSYRGSRTNKHGQESISSVISGRECGNYQLSIKDIQCLSGGRIKIGVNNIAVQSNKSKKCLLLIRFSLHNDNTHKFRSCTGCKQNAIRKLTGYERIATD